MEMAANPQELGTGMGPIVPCGPQGEPVLSDTVLSRTGRQYIPVAEATQSVVLFYSSPSKPVQRPVPRYPLFLLSAVLGPRRPTRMPVMELPNGLTP